MTGYREWTPVGPVGELLECAWQSRTGPADTRDQRVLPDGCMDLLVLRGRLVVAGPDTAAHTSHVAGGSVTSGLRFRPGVLPALLAVPADELRNRRVELADVLGTAEMRVSVPDGLAGDRPVHLDAAELLLDTAARLADRSWSCGTINTVDMAPVAVPPRAGRP